VESVWDGEGWRGGAFGEKRKVRVCVGRTFVVEKPKKFKKKYRKNGGIVLNQSRIKAKSKYSQSEIREIKEKSERKN